MAHEDSLDWEMGRWLAKQHDCIAGPHREQDGTITLTSPGREPFAYGATTSGGWQCEWVNSDGATMTATARHLHSLIPECTRHWLGEAMQGDGKTRCAT